MKVLPLAIMLCLSIGICAEPEVDQELKEQAKLLASKDQEEIDGAIRKLLYVRSKKVLDPIACDLIKCAASAQKNDKIWDLLTTIHCPKDKETIDTVKQLVQKCVASKNRKGISALLLLVGTLGAESKPFHQFVSWALSYKDKSNTSYSYATLLCMARLGTEGKPFAPMMSAYCSKDPNNIDALACLAAISQSVPAAAFRTRLKSATKSSYLLSMVITQPNIRSLLADADGKTRRLAWGALWVYEAEIRSGHRFQFRIPETLDFSHSLRDSSKLPPLLQVYNEYLPHLKRLAATENEERVYSGAERTMRSLKHLVKAQKTTDAASKDF